MMKLVYMADLGSALFEVRVQVPFPVFFKQGGIMVTRQAHNLSIGGSIPLLVNLRDYSSVVEQ